MRSVHVFSASRAASATVSSCVTPTRTSSPSGWDAAADYVSLFSSPHYFEAALLITLLGFVSTAAFSKFLMRGEVIE